MGKSQFLDTSSRQELPMEESGRIIGSLFAHESFNNLTSRVAAHPQLTEELKYNPSPTVKATNFGHQEIDRKFSTNYASVYDDPNYSADFTTHSYQLRAEKALSSGHYNQAIQDLGKAIELDPASPFPYLERGVAHFGLAQYDKSVEDYHAYTAQTETISSLSVPDFSLGFAKGLPQGIYDSGEGMFLFLSDLVSHPVHTAGKMWEALTLLSNLVRTEQWSALREVLTPEVHQLIEEWDALSSDTRGELAGYAFGKHGSDIIIPGALAKAVSKGLQGAQEISAVYKSLQTAEKTLLLESAAGIGDSAKIGEIVEATHTIIQAEELGFPVSEIAQLKKAGSLEETVAKSFQSIADNPVLLESAQRFKYAKEFLKPYIGKYMSETQARELIHQTGIPTLS